MLTHIRPQWNALPIDADSPGGRFLSQPTVTKAHEDSPVIGKQERANTWTLYQLL
jgi:hypothetical protein